MVRTRCKKKANDISDESLRALWCALDADDSNAVQHDEIKAFLKRGELTHAARRGGQASFVKSSNELSSLNAAIASTPTSEMRAELELAGMALPAGDELSALSTTFNAWLTAGFYEGGGKADALSWVDLYNFFDDDGSGFLTFDELCRVVRTRCKKKANDISDESLRALWCALDADDSNAVQRDEMAKFLRRGEQKRATPMKRGGQGTSLKGSNELSSMNAAIASTPTSEMRAELESAGVALPSDAQLNVLSSQFNAWLEAAIISAGSKTKSLTWHHL